MKRYHEGYKAINLDCCGQGLFIVSSSDTPCTPSCRTMRSADYPCLYLTLVSAVNASGDGILRYTCIGGVLSVSYSRGEVFRKVWKGCQRPVVSFFLRHPPLSTSHQTLRLQYRYILENC